MDFTGKLKQSTYLKKYIFALNKRIHLSKFDFDKKNSFEKNELLILELETLIKINKVKDKIEKSEQELFYLINE